MVIIAPKYAINTPGTVIKVNQKLSNILIGRKKGDPGDWGWDRKSDLSSVPEEYSHAWYLNFINDVEILSTTAATQTAAVFSAGMQCSSRFCKVFVPMAEPNTPTGEFVCYSCRQRPSYMR